MRLLLTALMVSVLTGCVGYVHDHGPYYGGPYYSNGGYYNPFWYDYDVYPGFRYEYHDGHYHHFDGGRRDVRPVRPRHFDRNVQPGHSDRGGRFEGSQRGGGHSEDGHRGGGHGR